MKQRLFAISMALLCCVLSTQAKAPIKFGKVSIEELEMTTYEPDTSAVAVVLCKYGYFSGNDLTFRQVRRVKVLKKAGVGYAEFSFPGPESMEVRGRVYNLVDGKIKEEKLKSESKFKVRIVDDWYNIRVALPNVKVGSVFEIETTQFLLPSEFKFQESIPVKYTELKIESTQYLEFRKRSRGYITINNIGTDHFKANDVPAFKSEAYMDSKENYISKLEFDLLKVSFPGYYREYTTTWGSVNTRLMKNYYFGQVLRTSPGFLSKINKEIEASCSTEKDKLQAAYDAIKAVKWNGSTSVYTSDQSLSPCFKEKSGNSTDLNMMLLKLLKKLEIESYPVVLSTRDHGQLHKFYPSFNKLNYMIVQAVIGEETYLLDATEKNLPLGMLPKRCLNKNARLVNDFEGLWVDVSTTEKEKEHFQYDLVLNEDLILEGTLDCKRYGYAAFDFRNKYMNYASEEEYINDIESKFEGLRIINHKLDDLDSIKHPVDEHYDIKLDVGVQKMGDLVMLSPFIHQRITESPFKLEERVYPVDFAYKQEDFISSKIQIPANYSVEELPKPLRVSLPDKSASALISYSVLGNVINAMYSVKISKELFLPEEYDYLKKLYALLIQKQSEPIILKKNLDEAKL